MKVLKWLLFVLLGLIAVLLIGGLLLSPKYTVTRSVVIEAPPEKVYALLASPKQWARWTVWNQRDPAMHVDYSGPETGAGAKWSWKSTSQGSGTMTFTASEPGKRVAYELYFPDFGTTSTGDLSLAPDASRTRVTWVMNGDMGSNPLLRWMTLMIDEMVGQDFAAGLANLKGLAEKS